MIIKKNTTYKLYRPSVDFSQKLLVIFEILEWTNLVMEKEIKILY